MARAPVLAVLIAASLAVVGVASASQPEAPAQAARDPRRVVVRVTVIGPATDAAALKDTLRELFARLQLLVEDDAVEGAPAEAVLARARIDLTSPETAAVVVTDGQTGEVIEQRRVRRDPSASIAREEVAHLVQSMVASRLLVDPERAPPPPPAPAPAPPPIAVGPPPAVPLARDAATPAPAARSAFALDIGTLVGGGPFASGAGLQARVGGSVAAAWRRGPYPALAVTGAYGLPTETGTSLVASHASVAALRGLASIAAVRSSWLALVTGVGGGLDVLTIEPRSAELPASALNGASTRTDVILTAAVGARVAVTDSVALTLDAVADLDLAERRYVLNEGGTQTVVLAPWRVRPMLLAGFQFTALGEGIFAKRGPR